MEAYTKAIGEDANPETIKLVSDDGAAAIKLDKDKGPALVDTLVKEWKKIMEAGQTLSDEAGKLTKDLTKELTK